MHQHGKPHKHGDGVTVTGSRTCSAVELVEQLHCPGCGDPVLDEAPTDVDGHGATGVEFCHRDGSPLCPDGRGRVGCPVEAMR